GAAIADLQARSDRIAAFRGASADLDRAFVAWRAARQRVGELQRQIEIAAEPSRALQTEFRRAQRDADRAREAFLAKGRAVRRLGADLRSAGVNTRALAAEQQRLGSALAEVQRRQERLRLAEVARERRGQLLGQAAREAAKAVALGAALKPAISQAAQFEHALARFGTVANISGDALETVGRQVIGLSSITNQAAGDLLRGLEFLVGKGLDPAKASAAIGTIGRAATATGASIEDLAAASFALIDNLEVAPEALPKALDMLAQAGKEGGFELRDMAREFPRLTAGAAMLGLKGSEAVASLSAALQVALKGAADPAEAANNFANFIAKVTSPETVQRFRKFGIDIEQEINAALVGGVNPIERMIGLIQEASDGDQFKMGELFGDMQVLNFLKPMIRNMAEFRRIKEATGKAGGVVDADFATMMATATEQARGFGIAIANLGRALGTALLPMIAPVIGAFRGIAEVATGAIEAFPGVARVAIGVAFAFMALRTALIGLAIVQTIGPAFAAFGGGLGIVGSVAAIAGRVLPLLAAGIHAVGIAVVANPVGLIVAGIAAAVVGAALLIWKYWEPIGAFFAGLGRGIVGGLGPVGAALATIGDSLSATFGPAIAALSGAFSFLAPAIDAVGSALSDLARWFGRLFEPIHLAADELAAVGSAGEAVGRVIGGTLAAAFQAVVKPIELAGTAVDWVAGKLGGIAGSVGKLLGLLGRAWGDAAMTVPGEMGGFALPGRGGTFRGVNDNRPPRPGAAIGDIDHGFAPARPGTAVAAPPMALSPVLAATGTDGIMSLRPPTQLASARNETVVTVNAAASDLGEAIARAVRVELERIDRDRAHARRASLFDLVE
ncbi:MAG: phage tail tape measure protein, partial [Alphaproteobacteria bacterium]|nr:phage tail tape measure protein [Alphaproteobacteria bacterium]